MDLILIGLNTDTDTVRIHIPDAQGDISLDCYIEVADLLALGESASTSLDVLEQFVDERADAASRSRPVAGMRRFVAWLVSNNLGHADYVRRYFKGQYADLGHEERFIGVGSGFEEIQLRNLTYFSFLDTVEEGAPDLDVGVKIFTKLNISRSLPIPVVVRFYYDGNVPGSRDRAVGHCYRVQRAINERYQQLTQNGMLHTLLTVRNQLGNDKVEVVGCSLDGLSA